MYPGLFKQIYLYIIDHSFWLGGFSWQYITKVLLLPSPIILFNHPLSDLRAIPIDNSIIRLPIQNNWTYYCRNTIYCILTLKENNLDVSESF
jgi:hypothetical protein